MHGIQRNERHGEMNITLRLLLGYFLIVGLRVVASVGHQCGGFAKLFRKGDKLFQHGADLLFVVGRMHGVGFYNQQASHIHRNLAVVALFESASRRFHDADSVFDPGVAGIDLFGEFVRFYVVSYFKDSALDRVNPGKLHRS